jgi:hypothetical protein
LDVFTPPLLKVVRKPTVTHAGIASHKDKIVEKGFRKTSLTSIAEILPHPNG